MTAGLLLPLLLFGPILLGQNGFRITFGIDRGSTTQPPTTPPPPGPSPPPGPAPGPPTNTSRRRKRSTINFPTKVYNLQDIQNNILNDIYLSRLSDGKSEYGFVKVSDVRRKKRSIVFLPKVKGVPKMEKVDFRDFGATELPLKISDTVRLNVPLTISPIEQAGDVRRYIFKPNAVGADKSGGFAPEDTERSRTNSTKSAVAVIEADIVSGEAIQNFDNSNEDGSTNMPSEGEQTVDIHPRPEKYDTKSDSLTDMKVIEISEGKIFDHQPNDSALHSDVQIATSDKVVYQPFNESAISGESSEDLVSKTDFSEDANVNFYTGQGVSKMEKAINAEEETAFMKLTSNKNVKTPAFESPMEVKDDSIMESIRSPMQNAGADMGSVAVAASIFQSANHKPMRIAERVEEMPLIKAASKEDSLIQKEQLAGKQTVQPADERLSNKEEDYKAADNSSLALEARMEDLSKIQEEQPHAKAPESLTNYFSSNVQQESNKRPMQVPESFLLFEEQPESGISEQLHAIVLKETENDVSDENAETSEKVIPGEDGELADEEVGENPFEIKEEEHEEKDEKESDLHIIYPLILQSGEQGMNGELLPSENVLLQQEDQVADKDLTVTLSYNETNESMDKELESPEKVSVVQDSRIKESEVETIQEPIAEVKKTFPITAAEDEKPGFEESELPLFVSLLSQNQEPASPVNSASIQSGQRSGKALEIIEPSLQQNDKNANENQSAPILSPMPRSGFPFGKVLPSSFANMPEDKKLMPIVKSSMTKIGEQTENKKSELEGKHLFKPEDRIQTLILKPLIEEEEEQSAQQLLGVQQYSNAAPIQLSESKQQPTVIVMPSSPPSVKIPVVQEEMKKWPLEVVLTPLLKAKEAKDNFNLQEKRRPLSAVLAPPAKSLLTQEKKIVGDKKAGSKDVLPGKYVEHGIKQSELPSKAPLKSFKNTGNATPNKIFSAVTIASEIENTREVALDSPNDDQLNSKVSDSAQQEEAQNKDTYSNDSDDDDDYESKEVFFPIFNEHRGKLKDKNRPRNFNKFVRYPDKRTARSIRRGKQGTFNFPLLNIFSPHDLGETIGVQAADTGSTDSSPVVEKEPLEIKDAESKSNVQMFVYDTHLNRSEPDIEGVSGLVFSDGDHVLGRLFVRKAEIMKTQEMRRVVDENQLSEESSKYEKCYTEVLENMEAERVEDKIEDTDSFRHLQEILSAVSKCHDELGHDIASKPKYFPAQKRQMKLEEAKNFQDMDLLEERGLTSQQQGTFSSLPSGIRERLLNIIRRIAIASIGPDSSSQNLSSNSEG